MSRTSADRGQTALHISWLAFAWRCWGTKEQIRGPVTPRAKKLGPRHGPRARRAGVWARVGVYLYVLLEVASTM